MFPPNHYQMRILCVGLWALVVQIYVPPWRVVVALPPIRVLDPEIPPANPNYILRRYAPRWDPPTEEGTLGVYLDRERYEFQIGSTLLITVTVFLMLAGPDEAFRQCNVRKA